MQKKIIDIPLPLGGVNKRMAYGRQPPMTSFDGLNIFPESVGDGRIRMGTRPGLGSAYPTTLGSGNPVVMQGQVRSANENGQLSFEDDFTAFHGKFSQPSWLDGLYALYPGTGGGGYARTRLSESKESVGGTYVEANFDATQAYVVQIQPFPVPILGYGGDFAIYLRLDNTTPNYSVDGFRFKIASISDTQFQLSWTVVTTGTPSTTVVSNFTHDGLPGWFKVMVVGNVFSVYWNATLLTSFTNSSHSSKKRIAFGITSDNTKGDMYVNTFRFSYYQSTVVITGNRNLYLASSNGTLYRTGVSDPSVLEAVSATPTIASDKQIMVQEDQGNAYIADYGKVASGSDGIIGTNGITFTNTAATNFATAGVTAASHMVRMLEDGVLDQVVVGTYKISNVSGATITLASSCIIGSIADSGISFRVERAPKKYAPAFDALTIPTPTVGYLPVGNSIICLFQDRLFWAGDAYVPHFWMCSRQGDPLDYDYGATDSGHAYSGADSRASLIAKPLTALAAISEDFMIMACADQMWKMVGDLAFGGAIVNLSFSLGIIDKMAFCFGPLGEFYFMSQMGLGRLEPGASSFPTLLSKEKMPRELINVDPKEYFCSMAYDLLRDGVVISFANRDSALLNNWFYHVKTDSFQPWATASRDFDIYTSFRFDDDSQIIDSPLFGGRDGLVKKFDETLNSDVGSFIRYFERNLYIGPLRMPDNESLDGFLDTLRIVMGADSGDADILIYTGQTAEEAVQNAFDDDESFSATVTAGLNHAIRPRRNGQYVVILLTQDNSGGIHWETERITATIAQTGLLRLA